MYFSGTGSLTSSMQLAYGLHERILISTAQLMFRVWVIIEPPADRRFWSMFPLTRATHFGAHIFDPQPLDIFGGDSLVHFAWMLGL